MSVYDLSAVHFTPTFEVRGWVVVVKVYHKYCSVIYFGEYVAFLLAVVVKLRLKHWILMEEKYLSELYCNPESAASFGGVDSIYRAVKNDAKYQISRNKIHSWLQKQDTYTLYQPIRYRFKRNRVIVGAIDEQ